jgi:hypothetical protein
MPELIPHEREKRANDKRINEKISSIYNIFIAVFLAHGTFCPGPVSPARI